MKENLVALIDLGSNSIRLVIYKLDDTGNYKEVEKVKVSARLINYINIQRKVTKEGINLIIGTLLEFQKITCSYGISRIIGFATAVIRLSNNQKEILTEIENQTGFSFRVLSEYEEAHYGYLGVVHSMNIKEGITIDTGGGSTEITMFQEQNMVHYHSFPFGAITLNNEFTKWEQASDKQWDRLKSYLLTQYQSLSWLEGANCPVIGIGGSARSLARMFQTKSKSTLRYDEIERRFAELSSLPMNKRTKINGLSKKRKDIIIPGLQTILTLMEVAQAPHFIYSETTIRDGVIYEEFINKKLYN
ncbi:exopolyphosphatase [Halalkalibacter lacteus]|uniref:Ppx/GppA phosphatase family protein n=1 Tax=Halalkalibacter lacteus TaxID=3090663 RepID=UPI002FCB20C0